MKKSIGLLIGLILILFCGMIYHHFYKISKCDFFRDGKCLMCDGPESFPVGYKDNCEKCSERTAYYVDEGLFPAWFCAVKLKEKENVSEVKYIVRSNDDCPFNRPLKDVVGNCYSCETEENVLVGPREEESVCREKRYRLPDGLLEKSLKCPDFQNISDPEVCVACQGVVTLDGCKTEGENHFCNTNDDCSQEEWCYPFKLRREYYGVCSPISEGKWICSQTDGYDLERTKLFCAGQKAHIPSLDEIENAEEDLKMVCPTLDMWTFFEPDGTVWLESFTQEFLFTREGESEKLGGHTFYALCHKD